MSKEQKICVFALSIVAILVILLVTPVAQAAVDIDWLAVTSYKSYIDGTPESAQPWRFEMWVEVVDPGGLVDHIDVTPPGPATPFPLSKYNGSWEWEASSQYPSLATLRTDYPLGTYTFDFYDSGNYKLDSVSLNYSITDVPSMPVDFTYPSVDGETGISINPMFMWTVDASAGDTLMMGLGDDVTDDDLYWDAPVLMTTPSWTPGPLQAGHEYWLEVSVLEVKDWLGPDWPTETTVGGDEFRYCLMIEYLNEIEFTTAPAPGTLSGWVWMAYDSNFGYHLHEDCGDCLLYFYLPEPVWSYNFDTGEWTWEKPVGWIYGDWPFYYMLDTNCLMFALPPESGLWVYHFCTGEWTVLPRIIPW